jgi:hypothetical protein
LNRSLFVSFAFRNNFFIVYIQISCRGGKVNVDVST